MPRSTTSRRPNSASYKVRQKLYWSVRAWRSPSSARAPCTLGCRRRCRPRSAGVERARQCESSEASLTIGAGMLAPGRRPSGGGRRRRRPGCCPASRRGAPAPPRAPPPAAPGLDHDVDDLAPRPGCQLEPLTEGHPGTSSIAMNGCAPSCRCRDHDHVGVHQALCQRLGLAQRPPARRCPSARCAGLHRDLAVELRS